MISSFDEKQDETVKRVNTHVSRIIEENCEDYTPFNRSYLCNSKEEAISKARTSEIERDFENLMMSQFVQDSK